MAIDLFTFDGKRVTRPTGFGRGYEFVEDLEEGDGDVPGSYECYDTEDDWSFEIREKRDKCKR